MSFFPEFFVSYLIISNCEKQLIVLERDEVSCSDNIC